MFKLGPSGLSYHLGCRCKTTTTKKKKTTTSKFIFYFPNEKQLKVQEKARKNDLCNYGASKQFL
jgi:hypothetical protein